MKMTRGVLPAGLVLLAVPAALAWSAPALSSLHPRRVSQLPVTVHGVNGALDGVVNGAVHGVADSAAFGRAVNGAVVPPVEHSSATTENTTAGTTTTVTTTTTNTSTTTTTTTTTTTAAPSTTAPSTTQPWSPEWLGHALASGLRSHEWTHALAALGAAPISAPDRAAEKSDDGAVKKGRMANQIDRFELAPPDAPAPDDVAILDARDRAERMRAQIATYGAAVDYAAVTDVQRARLARLDERDREEDARRAAEARGARMREQIATFGREGGAGTAEVQKTTAAAEAPSPSPARPTADHGRTVGVVTADKLGQLYDLVVVGGGPAGIAGAIQAAQMGRRAVVIDKPKFAAGVLPNGLDLFFGGPTGLWSKALRDAAKNTNVAAMKSQGMDGDVIWKQIQNSIAKLATRNAEGECRTLARYGIDYLQGSARLLEEDGEANLAALAKFSGDLDSPDDGVRTVEVTDAAVLDENGRLLEGSSAAVTGTKVLVCTGSKSTRLPGIPFEHSHRIFDSDTINLLDYLPRSVTIAGLGIIGIEFANIFNALGVEDVTIVIRGDVETSTKKLGMDMDVARELVRILKKSGVKILEGIAGFEFSHVPAPGANDELVRMQMSDGSDRETDLFFAATGRYAMGKDEVLGLAAAGVDVADRGMVTIDKQTLATSSKNVHAAGDVIGSPALASTSMEQGQRAVAAMFSEGADRERQSEAQHDAPLSIGIWTIPEMGYYGLTKERAEAEGYNVVEGSVGFDQCLRGRVFAPDGLLKLVVDADEGTVLGAHIIGKEAAEMVHYGMALVKARTSIFEILQTVYTAVTFHELFKQAALDANSQLDFGVEWQTIFASLDDVCDVDIEEVNMREKFNMIDQDGSGELDEGEMRTLFESMGRPVSKRIISNIMRLSDLDGNGTIDYGEFKAIFDKLEC